MGTRLPLFGLLSSRSPMDGFLEHYECILKGMQLIEEAMMCYITQDIGNACPEFQQLQLEVDEIEDRADKIKRNIRNNLPRGILLPVDRTLFFNYTRQQDNILDSGQNGLHWLSMRKVVIPESMQKDVLIFLEEVGNTIQILRPVLQGTVSLLSGESLNREEIKQACRDVRRQHKIVHKQQRSLIASILNSNEIDFKDCYQLVRFVERLHSMSHNTEGCSDILRAMIAK